MLEFIAGIHLSDASDDDHEDDKALNLSHNMLSVLSPHSLQSLSPSQLSSLDLGHNPWQCHPDNQWLHSWSLRSQLGESCKTNCDQSCSEVMIYKDYSL